MRYFPEDASDIFAEVEFAGVKCPLDEISVPLEGYLYGEVEPTGTSLVNQPVRFNSRSGSISGLWLGPDLAETSGESTIALTGVNAGKSFSAT